jgi:L-fuconolactonase
MDVVDAQFHLRPGRTDAMFGGMDALGIRSVLIEEFWYDPVEFAQNILQPGYPLENGAWRAIFPNAEMAAKQHPDRAAFYVRIDRRDPRLEAVMRILGDSPLCRGYRALATWTPEEAQEFAAGAYDEMFAVAEDVGMPMFLVIPGWAHHLARYADKYPRLSFVVDHTGVHGDYGIEQADLGGSSRLGYFDRVLDLAQHPNVHLKWAHTQRLFDAPVYPYDAVRPYLRRAIAAFGADRILWASDASIIPEHTWSDLLHYLRDDPELSQEEKEWILGRTVRRLVDWPAPDAAA